MSNNEEVKSKVEVKRIRESNMHRAAQQLVDTYNASNGWALVRVVPLGINAEFILERSVKQATKPKTKVEAKDEEAEKDVVEVEQDEKKPTPTKTKTATKTNAK